MKYQNRKTATFESENRKTEPKIGLICETENPNAPLVEVQICKVLYGHGKTDK